jgi:hypothetical protein
MHNGSTISLIVNKIVVNKQSFLLNWLHCYAFIVVTVRMTFSPEATYSIEVVNGPANTRIDAFVANHHFST